MKIKWNWVLGFAIFFSLGNFAIKIAGNYLDGNALLSGSILFTIVFWFVAGAIFGFIASAKRQI